MTDVTFITGNQHKADLLAAQLGVSLEHQKIDLDELQSFSLHEIAEHKARQAYDIIKRPVLVEDMALTFHALGRLPGTFIKWFVQELSLQQLCDIVPTDNRAATATICYCLFDGDSVMYFDGAVLGSIAASPRGQRGFGYDPIFIPDGQTLTNAEMDDEAVAKFGIRMTTVYPEIRAYLATKHI